MMTTHNDELLPCPFCRGSNLSIHAYDVQPDDYHDAYVECDYCSAQGRHAMMIDGWLSSKAEAIQEAKAAWNRRAEQPQPAPMQVDSRAAFERWISESTYANDGLSFHNDLFNAWQAALASRAEHAVQDGWKLVPIEPTDAMLDAKPKSPGAQGQCVNSMRRNANRAMYKAMIEVAQQDKGKETV